MHIKIRNHYRQILHVLYQHNKVTKKIYNNLIKSINLWKNMIATGLETRTT